MSKKELVLAEIYRQNRHWKDAHAFFADLQDIKQSRLLFKTIIPYLGKKEIISVIGLRRTGKTAILKQLMQGIIKQTKPENIFFLTLDEDLLGGRVSLADYINAFLGMSDSHEQRYIFIDEVQYATRWQHIIKRYYDTEPRLKFVISGSSALFIKKQSTESLAGRIYEFKLPVLSFEEYLMIKGVQSELLSDFQQFSIAPGQKEIRKSDVERLVYRWGDDLKKHFYDYLFFGQFPAIVNESDIEVRKKYLIEAIYKKTLEYDIPKVFGVEKVEELKFLFQVAVSEIGSIIEIGNLASEAGLNKETVNKYLRYFENSFLIHFVYNFSKSFRKSRRLLRKIYLESVNFYAAFRDFDTLSVDSPVVGFLVENYFYNILQHQYQYIAFFRVRKEEFDFIATRDMMDKKSYHYFEVKHVNNMKESDLSFIRRQTKEKGDTYTVISKDTLEFSQQRNILPIWIINSR
jgi:predicted AAA+ superfamily ATPase